MAELGHSDVPEMVDKLRFFADSAHSAPDNMAIDELLLGTDCGPILRFYRWEHPTVSLGYFLKIGAVKLRYGPEFKYVRRWTGGGSVEHGTNETWTYALVLPSTCDLTKQRSRQLYSYVHRALSRALDSHDAIDEASLSPAAEPGGACFANPVAGDLLFEGRKIAGAAMRRVRSGILLQGSIAGMPNDDCLPARFASLLANVVEPFDPSRDCTRFRQRVRELSRTKYGSQGWLERH